MIKISWWGWNQKNFNIGKSVKWMLWFNDDQQITVGKFIFVGTVFDVVSNYFIKSVNRGALWLGKRSRQLKLSLSDNLASVGPSRRRFVRRHFNKTYHSLTHLRTIKLAIITCYIVKFLLTKSRLMQKKLMLLILKVYGIWKRGIFMILYLFSFLSIPK